MGQRSLTLKRVNFVLHLPSLIYVDKYLLGEKNTSFPQAYKPLLIPN